MDPATMQEESSQPATSPEGNAGKAAPAVQRFDFRHPVFLSSGEWRRLRLEMEEMAESLAALLSTYFRLDFALQVSNLQTITFSEFTGKLPAPTHVTLFKCEPLRGISLLEVRPVLGLCIVDRLLGGSGQGTPLQRNLSEMEIALLDQYVEIILGEWCKHWSKLQEMRPVILGHENNPRFLQSSTSGTVMLVVTIEARMGDIVDQMQLAVPYNTLEPVIRKLGQDVQAPAPPAPAAVPPVKWNRGLEELPVRVTARWPGVELTTRRLLELKPGDLIELSPEQAEKIEVRLGSVVKFRARLGARNGSRAVQITEVVKS